MQKLVRNDKTNREYKRGFTHRLVDENGDFLFVHKSRLHIEKAKLRRKPTAIMNVLKASEGGISFADAKALLAEAGITDIRRTTSCYVGQYAIIVPASQSNKAGRILYRR